MLSVIVFNQSSNFLAPINNVECQWKWRNTCNPDPNSEEFLNQFRQMRTQPDIQTHAFTTHTHTHTHTHTTYTYTPHTFKYTYTLSMCLRPFSRLCTLYIVYNRCTLRWHFAIFPLIYSCFRTARQPYMLIKVILLIIMLIK